MSEFQAEKDELTVDLIRLRHAVSEMRECIVLRLNALEDQIEALLPKEKPVAPRTWDIETVRSWVKRNRANTHNK